MAERIDPLGKRSLFWAPGTAEAAHGLPAPSRTTNRRSVAKRGTGAAARAPRPAAGSAHPSAPAARPSSGRAAGTTSMPARPGAPRRLAIASTKDVPPAASGKRALFSERPPVGAAPVGPAAAATDRPGGPPAGMAAVRLHCATCGSRTTVSVARFVRLHLPLFLWRPGPGFARFMTCPSCRRRAWISASWPAPGAGLAPAAEDAPPTSRRR